jgi:hypothetical protein
MLPANSEGHARKELEMKTLWGTRAVMLSMLVSALMAQAGKAPANLNATTTIFDNDSAGAPLLSRSDGALSGQTKAAYASANNVSSVILSSDGWQLLLANQSLRTVWLTLGSQGVHDGTTVIPDAYYWESVELGSRCWDAAGKVIAFTAIQPGTAQTNCSLIVDFKYGSTGYKLAMGPTWANTGFVLVTCNAAANNACKSWTIVPSTTSANATVANLYRTSVTGNPHSGPTFLAPYHNTFRVDVTVP